MGGEPRSSDPAWKDGKTLIIGERFLTHFEKWEIWPPSCPVTTQPFGWQQCCANEVGFVGWRSFVSGREWVGERHASTP